MTNMKTLQIKLLIAICVLMLSTIAFAQNNDKFQAYVVHEDQVKPSKVMEYEKAAKALVDKMKEHKITSTSWLTSTTDDFRYLYVTPLKNMAELDNNAFAPLVEKMGQEAFRDLMSAFNPCYDRHGDYVIFMDKELTYMPKGITQTPEGQNYRKFFYIYVSPKNNSKMRDAMMDVKKMFKEKNSTSYYRVYRSGFGNMDNYYMVAIAAKDPVAMEQQGAANDKLLGDEAAAVFGKVLGLALRFEEYTGSVRPELGYMPSKN